MNRIFGCDGVFGMEMRANMPIIDDVNGGTEADRKAAARLLAGAIALGALLLLLVTAGPVASAHATYAVGVSDNKASTFHDPRLKQIGIKTARLITPWNAISTEPERLAEWLHAARAAHIQPLVSFDRSRKNNCPARPCFLPSVKQFTREFKKFRKKYPWVRYYTPWNEANHPNQPTAKRPDRVAAYHDAILDTCRKCKVVAGDPLDTPGVGGWMKSYEKTLKTKHRRKVTIWGLHNYLSANYFRPNGTVEALRATKADIWLTETGGIVQMLTFDATRLEYDENRAARALTFVLGLAAKYPCRIKRSYIYNWQAAPKDRFDTGVITHEGRARPAFDVLVSAMQSTSPMQQRAARCSERRAKAKAGRR